MDSLDFKKLQEQSLAYNIVICKINTEYLTLEQKELWRKLNEDFENFLMWGKPRTNDTNLHTKL